MTEPATKRKRISLKAGDVFEMTLADGRFGYGVIIVGGGVPYIIVLRTLHAQRPSIEALRSGPIALVGWTMDALIYHGRWKVVFSDYPTRPDVPYPNWKVGVRGSIQTTDFTGKVLGPATSDEIDLLDYKFSQSPIAYQHALEALHDLQPWRADYDQLTPGYLTLRTTRPRRD